MLDILICSVPSGVLNRPPAALAILKASVLQIGLTAKTIDLSLEVYINQCRRDLTVYTEEMRVFEPLVSFTDTDVVREWLINSIDIIKKMQPKYIGISVFSNFQHRATVLLCQLLRKQLPNIQIILGGYGIVESTDDSFCGFTSAIDRVGTFEMYMRKHNLVDHIVIGEGESNLLNILQNNSPTTDVVNLDKLPISDFSDYKLSEYVWHDQPVLTITGSKGCVRACTFCNVPRKFGRYRKMSGKRIATEMIELKNLYGVRKFEFTDSLVNGSQKDFYEWINIIADYNLQQPKDQRLTWYGQYICRPQAHIPKDIYQKIKDSGAVNLIIGAESGSNDVLKAMHKKITVEDIYDELIQFEKHGLQCQFLILNGFYNETWERYLETLVFISNCHRYLAAGVIGKIAVGFPLIIEDGGYIQQHADELGIIESENKITWRVKDDPSNIWLERLRRRVITQLLLNKMGASMTGNGILELKLMIEQLTLYEQQLRSSDSTVNIKLPGLELH